jgi:hypothetical protein
MQLFRRGLPGLPAREWAQARSSHIHNVQPALDALKVTVEAVRCDLLMSIGGGEIAEVLNNRGLPGLKDREAAIGSSSLRSTRSSVA